METSGADPGEVRPYETEPPPTQEEPGDPADPGVHAEQQDAEPDQDEGAGKKE